MTPREARVHIGDAVAHDDGRTGIIADVEDGKARLLCWPGEDEGELVDPAFLTLLTPEQARRRDWRAGLRTSSG